MRILKGTHATITSPTFAAGDVPTACDSTPTCAVVNAAGTTLTAPTVTADSTAPGTYTAALTPTHTAELDQLSITWTGAVSSSTQILTDVVDIVGAHYVTLIELRRWLPNSKYPTADVIEARDRWCDYVEEVAGVAFVPSFARETLDGTGLLELRLSHCEVTRVISCTVDGTAVTDVDLVVGEWARRSAGWARPSSGPNVVISYQHGLPAPPGRLKGELVRAIVGDVTAKIAGGPADQISETVDGRTIRFSTPDYMRDRPTGRLDLDATIAAYSRRIPGIA